MDNKHCIVCGAEAPKRCSGCRSVHYCSIEHQKLHWKEHKLCCTLLPYRVEWDVDIGYHLVANKNIEPGDLILVEEPLIIVPMNINGPSAVCVGCNQNLKPSEAVNCPQCNWPMCGKQKCWGEGSLHALGECALLKAAGDRVTASYSRWTPKVVVYRSIWILRCLSLKEKEPAKWDKLVKMTKSLHSATSAQQIGGGFKDVVKLVNQWIPDTNIPKGLIKKICLLFLANRFDLFSKSYMGLSGIYSLASMMQHRCVSNVSCGFMESGKMVIRAAVSITKGSRIYHDYTIGGFCFTLKRQLILAQTRFGSCACQRCKDPTELGTLASGIYCPRCPNLEGVLLSENPLNQDADWLCNKCSLRLSFEHLSQHLIHDPMMELASLDRSSVPDCEKYIQKYAKILHPHNFLLTDIKLHLVDNYRLSTSENNINDTDREMLEKKEALILDLLKIADIVCPGLSNTRKTLLSNFFSIVDIRRNAGLIDDNTVKSAGGPSRAELELYDKFGKCQHGLLYYNRK